MIGLSLGGFLVGINVRNISLYTC